MNKHQEQTVAKVKEHLIFIPAQEEIKECTVDEYVDGTIGVMVTRGLKGCVSTVVDMLTQETYFFHVGKNGGLYRYTDKFKREYIGLHDITTKTKIC